MQFVEINQNEILIEDLRFNTFDCLVKILQYI